MEEQRARALFPAWAENDVKVYKPKGEEPKRRWKINLGERANQFIRRNLIAILVILAFALEGWAVALYTEHRVTREVTETVTSELRAGFTRYLEEQEQKRQAAGLLTGDASKQTAMDAEADAIAKLTYGYRNNSLRDRKTLIWCVLARVDNNGYPGSVQAVIDQPQQWMFYSNDNPIREDDRNLAMEQLQLWHDGKYPAGLSSDYVYAEWTQTDIALRNTWEKNSATGYWRMPE